MLACLHEFSSPPPLSNACHAGYNLIDLPTHQNQGWESGTFWPLEGFILNFRGKGDLLAVPVCSVRDCNLGQNR